ncbi:MAG: FecCD family ABC transporter permease [Spirochaetota bacterium]
MHLENGTIPEEYRRYTGRKAAFLAGGLLLLAALLVLSISVGAVRIPPAQVLVALLGGGSSSRWDLIVRGIRLPQALTTIAAGMGLAAAGAAMQSILRNPLGSPFTLGISQAAAFGAALSVMVIGTGTMRSTGADAVVISNPSLTTAAAFAFSLVGMGVILVITRLRSASPETMVLAGVAMGSLFTAGTMFLQYFADDVQLAAMVFWTFGDTSRASWRELGGIAAVAAAAASFFTANRWNYNAIDAGEETARGLGVHVRRVRVTGMLCASVVTAVIVSFLGIIGFVGLVAPHLVRLLIGGDHRFLLPGTCLAGAVLLLAADTAARVMLAPHLLPVSVLTSFLGAPVFIYLLVRGQGR